MMVEKKATICISSLFTLLLALQFNSVGFTPAFAQLEGLDGENVSLNGMWQRIDDDPIEDMLHIEQEGSTITAT
jgi:hypothetical protein